MVKKRISPVLIAAAVVTLILLNVSSVSAIAVDNPPFKPVAGSWTWDNQDVTGTVVPQYQLAPTFDSDYALLQSAGIYLNGGAQLCHPYPGGQFGWNAEIRVLTSRGWQPVPTVNEWVPDVEGKFMTCANVWSSGTYAVFGYWEKPDGWGIVDYSCPDLPEGDYAYVGPAATFAWQTVRPRENLVGQYCYNREPIYISPWDEIPARRGWVRYDYNDGNGSWAGLDLSAYGYYCACDAVYMRSDFR